ncbi:MAG: hypothetical protein Q8L48_32880 [Archangium sp.]|nr:hypothetical protein [Archangium sp.]
MRRALLAVTVLSVGLTLTSCQKRHSDAPAPVALAPVEPAAAAPDPATQIRAAEEAATLREAERPKCAHPVSIYEGSIAVDASDYLHPVPQGDDSVHVAIEGLDRTISPATRVSFTLDYPFEKPLGGVVTGKLTLRHIIDGIRGGFRKMYEGATVRDIPGMMNKDVTGPYGNAFHVIGDLVIERIELCDGDRLEISIGS